MHIIYYLLLCFVCTQAQSQVKCNLTLKGHIVDKELGIALKDASVTIINTSLKVVSDVEGNFQFKDLCAGKYELLVTHIGCAAFRKTIELNKDLHLDIELPHSITNEAEVTVLATTERKNAGMTKQLTETDLDKVRGSTITEMLQRMNGVGQLQTGSTISKPIVHGLSGVRVLMINNGVRQEGQQWGNDHAPEIDPFLASKLTLIKGVDELRYGGDALGGVILSEPKSLQLVNQKAANIFTGYSTNNKLAYGSIQYEAPIKNQQIRVQASFRKAANLSTPNYRLNNTAFQEMNGSLAYRTAKYNNTFELFASQFNTQLGVFTGAHIGNLTDLNNAINASAPNDVYTNQQTYSIGRPRQDVNHQLLKLKFTKQLSTNKWTANVHAQRNVRREFDIVRNPSITSPQLTLSLLTFYEDLVLEHKKIKRSNGTIGVAATQQVNDYSGRYIIPNYFSNNVGLFAMQKWNFPHWEYQVGLRGDYKQIATKRLRFNGTENNYDFDFATFAGAANVTRKFTSHLKTNFALSVSSRAPYVNELLSDGIHHGTATYEQGDLQLKPEQSLFINWNWFYNSHSERMNIEVNLHHNIIRNFIYQQQIPSQPVLTIAGAFPKVVWQQTNSRLSGIDFAANATINKMLQYNTKLSAIVGYNKAINDWMVGLPPIQWEQSLNIQLKDIGKLSNQSVQLSTMMVGEQKFLPDNFLPLYDYKAAPKGYTLVNIQYENTLNLKKQPVQFVLGVQNLFNTNYRNYLNAFRYYTDEMGRNISIKIKIPIIFINN